LKYCNFYPIKNKFEILRIEINYSSTIKTILISESYNEFYFIIFVYPVIGCGGIGDFSGTAVRWLSARCSVTE
jgi:hypothetical protein